MFFQRRRLQILLSLLVIISSCLFLGGQLLEGEPEPAVRADSQLSEAIFLLRHNYVQRLEERPLLESAVSALRSEAIRRGIGEVRLPTWTALPKQPGDEGLARVENYLVQVSSLDPAKLPREQAVYIAISGLLEALADPYTFVMDPKAYTKFQESLHTHVYGGAGLELEWTKGAYVVFEVAPNSPAGAAKIMAGDRLLEVDGIELAPPGKPAVTLHQARALLVGEVGARINARLQRAGAPYQRTLTLAKYESRSVLGRMIGDTAYGEPRVGWIVVNSLGEESGREMVETVALLAKKGAQGYVIDLRDNVGGYLNAAVEIASFWLPSGLPVVTVKGREANRSKYTIGAHRNNSSMVVLVNGRTASSAEILAASFREHGRAYILGDRTFGKGSVQTLYDFLDGGGFKMTTATYLTPSGKTLEGRGLTPDHAVDVGQGRDEALIQQDVLQLCRELWRKDPTDP